MIFDYKKIKRLSLGILAFTVGVVCAQGPDGNPVHWLGKPPLKSVCPGEEFEIKVEATIDGDWHLYSVTTPPEGPNPTRFSVASGAPVAIAGTIKQSSPTTKFDESFGVNTEYFSSNAHFRIPLKVAPNAKAGEQEAGLGVIYQLCNDRTCLPPRKVPISTKIRVVTAEAAAHKTVSSKLQKPITASNQAKPDNPGTESNMTVGTTAEIQQARAEGFWPYLWFSMTMGLISLATPCVFPMIPITVSYFTKKAEKRRTPGISHAVVYSAGIVFTFTGVGLGVAVILGTTGINQFAANPWINLAITAIFMGFALNLFGLFQIGVPSSVLTRLSNAGGSQGYVYTLLMGFTFTLTSFTCTVPFIGTVLVAASQGDWVWPALGMMGFSIVFSAPFFLLALIPKWLTTLPKSGGWLNSVKVTMGFLELAAAMKFVSNVDLIWNWHIFSREVVLAIWMSISVLATVYLLGKFRLPHDSPVETLTVMRMVFALVFLATSFVLFTGLMGGSLGELDAFLPPRTAGAATLTGCATRSSVLAWKIDMASALAEARQEQRFVFIDFTGYTCTNCRWMEANVFSLPAVQTELGKYVCVQLFTDGEGRQYEENQKYQRDRFGTVALPFYSIIDPDGNKIATFPGMTRNYEAFLRFLHTPQDARQIILNSSPQQTNRTDR